MKHLINRIMWAATFLVVVVMGSILAISANAENVTRPAVSAAELERARLAEIVAGLDQLLSQAEIASRTGAGGRVQFNYEALRKDLLGRRNLIQRYINGSWDAPRDIAPLANTYNR